MKDHLLINDTYDTRLFNTQNIRSFVVLITKMKDRYLAHSIN